MRAALLAVVACSSPPQHVKGDEGVPLQRDTPAPKIAWHADRFDVTGLPAIARGGEVAVIALRDSDGERDSPNIRLEVHDRTDKIVQTIEVLRPAEFDTLVHDGVPSAELTRRVTEADTELARLHGLHDLIAMHPLELQPGTDEHSERHLAIGDGIDVDWNGDHLHVFSHNADHPLVTLDGHAWLKQKVDSDCSNPAFLRAAFHTAGINAIVVDIAYHGTDSCVEPADQQHFVVW